MSFRALNRRRGRKKASKKGRGGWKGGRKAWRKRREIGSSNYDRREERKREQGRKGASPEHSILIPSWLQGTDHSFPHLLQRMAADKSDSHISFRACSCCCTAALPSGEVFCRTYSPRVTVIFIWISFSCLTDNSACWEQMQKPLNL